MKHRAHFWPSYLHRKEGEPASYLDEKTIQTIQCFFETRNLPNGGNYAFWVGLLIPTSPLDTIKNTHPLYYAASFGLTDVVRIVLDTEKNLNIDALGGRARASALHVAVYRDHIDIARMLLERGANPGLANNLGEAPLFWARINKNAEMAKLLREFGAVQLKRDWVWAMAEAEEDKVDFGGVGDADSSVIPKEYSVLFLEPPTRLFAAWRRPSPDKRPAVLVVALLIGLVLALVVPALRTYFGLTRPAVIVYETSIPLLVVWFLTLTAAYRFRVMDRLLGLPDLVGDRSAHADDLPA